MKYPVPLPREHGAWAILYGSFLTGFAAAWTLDLKILLFLMVVSGVFLSHEPLVKLIRSLKHGGQPELIRWWSFWLTAELTAVALAGSILLIHYQLFVLLPIGLVVAMLFGVHLKLSAGRKDRSVTGELLGIVGLTASGPSAYLVGVGNFDAAFWLIWSLNFLYFASGIFYVKMRVSRFLKPALFKRRARDCVIYHSLQGILLAAGALSGWIPWMMLLAFAPIIVRAFWHTFHSEKQLNIKRIGYSEVLFTVTFIVLFVFSWRTPSI